MEAEEPDELTDLFARLRAEAADRPGKLVPVREIARRTGRATGHISQCLAGTRRPSADFAETIARALGASPADVAAARRYAARSAPRRRAKAPNPDQLPPAPNAFSGRRADRDRLTEVARPGRVVVITGTGGIGKTWLAQRWAYDNSASFPAGQLYVDLHGFDSRGRVVPPGEAVVPFLSALGVATVPPGAAARLALFRRLAAGRRLLIVLDNALDAEQVRPLIPGGTATVLITSRTDLEGLQVRQGAEVIALRKLSAEDARAALISRLGEDRVRAENGAVATLLDVCGGLPLALGIVSARLSAHPDWSPAALAAELADERQRLDGLDSADPDIGLRVVFSWSAHPLDPAEHRAMCLLSLAFGGTVGRGTAAALIGVPEATARVLLRRLERVGLLEQQRPAQYSLHDLVRLYWLERAREQVPAGDRAEARRRLVRSMLHTAHSGERLLSPARPPIRLDPATGDTAADHPATADRALAWFDIEHARLLAAQQEAAEQRWDTEVWQLAWSLDNYHYRRGLTEQHDRAWRRGLAATLRIGDPAVIALAELCLGNVCTRSGHPDQAGHRLRRALLFSERTGDLILQAQVHRALALAASRPDGSRRSLHHAIAALRLFATLAEPWWQAIELNAVGEELARLGHPGIARRFCSAALDLHRRDRNRAGEAAAQDSLGIVEARAGDPVRAVGHYERALAIYRDLGNDYSTADTLTGLGKAFAAIPGRRADAVRCWTEAYARYQEQHRTGDAAEVAALLAR